MAKKQAEYLRVLLRGLTVPGAGVCAVGDLVHKDFVPADLWDMVKAGEHPHLVVHEGPVSMDKVREHRPRGIMTADHAPPPTPVRQQVAGRVIGIGHEVRPAEGATVGESQEGELADLVHEDAPEIVE